MRTYEKYDEQRKANFIKIIEFKFQTFIFKKKKVIRKT